MVGIGEFPRIAAKWAPFEATQWAEVGLQQTKGRFSVTRDFPECVAWPTWGVAPGYVEVGLRPTGTTVLNLG